jgi:Tol biopolymer transport system component
MPDLQEVFRIATQQVRPDPGALERQLREQRSFKVRRKVGAIALAAALAMAAAYITIRAWPAERNDTDRTGSDPLEPESAQPGIVIVDVSTGRSRHIVDVDPYSHPDVSPDGSRIAFHADVDGHSQINVMDADGTDSRVVTNDPFGAEDPDWSPDGAAIAYQAVGKGDAGWDIFVVDLGSGRIRRLTREMGDASDASWSPDGTRILYTVGRGNDTILRVVDVSSGVVMQLTSRGDSAAEGSWSPDGTTIAYSLDAVGGEVAGPDDGRHGIWLMDPDGSGRRELVTGDAASFRPLYSPDGTRIAYFVQDDDGCCDTYLVEVATGMSTKIAEGLLFPTWLDDGSLVGVTH